MGKVGNKNIGIIVGVIAFAVVAIAAAVLVFAVVGGSKSVEPEKSVDENTNVQQDDQASGDKFVEFGSNSEPTPDSTTYQVKIDITWNADDHGADFPGGAHTSPSVAVAHARSYAFFGQDTLASPGFKQVAETGATSTIRGELDTEKAAGTLDYALGSRLDAPESETIQLTLTKDQPLFSMVSMLAPSPDWVIGAQNIELYNADEDKWVETITFDLDTYDAGTDSGETFTAANLATDPQAFISAPVDEQLIRTAAIGFGTVTLTAVE